jgi:Ca-activated chloride channel family protein
VRTNFAAASAATGDRWRDAGWYMLFPLAIAFALTFRRGWVVRLSGVLLVARLVAPVPAEAAGFMDVWLTQDQQGRLAFERGDFAAAATLFADPMWKGVAMYRAGRFKEAAESLAPLATPDARFDRGNALLRAGSYEEAVAAYQQALQQRKDWLQAQANLTIAERLLKMQEDDDDQPQDPNEKPDDVTIDDKGKKGKTGKVDVAEQATEIWMKNIVLSPADLMARKFAIEAERASR